MTHDDASVETGVGGQANYDVMMRIVMMMRMMMMMMMMMVPFCQGTALAVATFFF